jgi:hypothetical protein
MITLYGGPQGQIIRMLRFPDDYRRFPDAPQGTAVTLAFDEETNTGVVTALWDDQRAHGLLLVDGRPQLQRDGVPVEIAAPGPTHEDRELAGQFRSMLEAGTPLSPGQKARLMLLVLRALRDLGVP